MRSSLALVVAALVGAATAHFQLSFPPPRGPFVEDDEPKFCDGYTDVTKNRTVFPLSGGFFTLNSEHPQWSAAVQIATTQNPNSFNDFQLVNNFFKVNGEGEFCIPLDFKSSNATGLQNNQNVTIQIIYNGGDGSLFQCADLTLSDSAKISSDVACKNGTDTSSSSSSSASGSPSSGSGSATGTATTSTTSQTAKSPAVPLFSSSTLAMTSAFIAAVSLVVL